MSLIILLAIIAAIGFATWALITYVPMPGPFKAGLIIIAVLGTIAWLLTGVDGVYLPHVRIR